MINSIPLTKKELKSLKQEASNLFLDRIEMLAQDIHYNMLYLGEIIREARKEKNISGKELIEKLKSCNIKFSHPYLSTIEQQGALPSARVLISLAHILDLDPHHLHQIKEGTYIRRCIDKLDEEFNLELKRQRRKHANK